MHFYLKSHFQKNIESTHRQLSATQDARHKRQHGENEGSHQQQQAFLTKSSCPANPSPLWRHPPILNHRLARALAAHRTPALDTRTQREHRESVRGEGGQGAQTKQMHAGCTGVRECTGSRAGHARMESKVLTCDIGASQRCIPRKSNRQPLKRTPTNAAQMQQVKYERAGTTASLLGTVTHMLCLSAVAQVKR